MRPCPYIKLIALVIFLLSSCSGHEGRNPGNNPAIPRFLHVDGLPGGGWEIVSISPFNGTKDTLVIDEPLDNIIVMSTSHIGFLDALGELDVVSGVSGKDYVYDSTHEYAEVGYDAAPDYEKIVSLNPDLLLTYTVSGMKSNFIERLEQLGIKVFIVNEHLEDHPLARASYIRLFGALTGTMEKADSILEAVSSAYDSLAAKVKESGAPAKRVLLNIPYNDQWFSPPKESYLWALFQDAGGEILGAEEGRTASSTISVEKAYSLSKEADSWINVGWCQDKRQLLGCNPIFSEMVRNVDGEVWNDNKRLNPRGGNDFWESGVVRPDRILRDLVKILHPEIIPETDTLFYYRPIR